MRIISDVQLTRFTDIAVRLMVELGSVPDQGQPTHTAASLAQAVNASTAHVTKVLTRLREMGLVLSARGRYGGIMLAPGALNRSVGQAVLQLEGNDDVASCSDECPLFSHDCLFRLRLRSAMEAFYNALEDLTFADLVAHDRGEVNGFDFPARRVAVADASENVPDPLRDRKISAVHRNDQRYT